MKPLTQNPVYDAQIVSINSIANNTYEITIATKNNVSFIPGQYFWIKLPNMQLNDPSGNIRAMSITNIPNKNNTLSFVIRGSNSGFKKSLLNMSAGENLLINGPFGVDFVLPKTFNKPLILIGAGVGIAPFISLVRQSVAAQLKIPITLISLNNKESEAPYYKEINDLNNANKHIHGLNIFRKLNTKDISNIKGFKNANVYVSGSQEFVDFTANLLTKTDIPLSHIYYENFYPTTTTTKYMHSLFKSTNKTPDLNNLKNNSHLDILKTAVESTSHHIIISDVNGMLLFANSAAEKMTGYSFPEMKGQTPRLWGGLMTKDFYKNAIWGAGKAGKDINAVLVNRRKNWQPYWVMAHITPLKDKDGTVIGYIGTEEDITKQVKIEHSLKIKDLVHSELSKHPFSNKTIQNILDIIAEGCGWDFGTLWIKSADNTLKCGFTWHKKEAHYKKFADITKSISIGNQLDFPSRAISDKTSVLTGNISNDENFPRAPYADLYNLNTNFCMPIIDDNNNIYAVLEFFAERQLNLDNFIENFIEMFNDIGKEIGQLWYEKQQQDIITHKESLLELATSSAKIGIWQWDLITNQVEWDDQMRQLYGLKPHDPTPTISEWKNLTHPEDKPILEEKWSAAISGKANLDAIFRIILTNGELKYIKAKAITERDHMGMPLKIIGINFDVTIEQEIDRQKTEFVSLASHQFKTPLSSISWNTEMLLNGDFGKLNPKQQKIINTIEQTNERMKELVGSLLNVSRIDLGVFLVEPEPVDYIKMCSEVLNELKDRIATKGHTIINKFQPNLPIMMADPKLLRIIFQNYISNAVKYTPNNGKIIISIEIVKNMLVISVANNGDPIPSEDQSKIFGKMFRASNAQTQDPDGNGLGLYLVKQIAENAGGKAWFESKKGKYTTFYISFPASGMQKNILHKA